MSDLVKLQAFVEHFAQGMKSADARQPVAFAHGSGAAYKPGLGPHSEGLTVKLVMEELGNQWPAQYRGEFSTDVPHASLERARCDLVLGTESQAIWVEVKMLRMLGDNGKDNDNMLMHILSPYPRHRSALTDCTKILAAPRQQGRWILIYAYEYERWPNEPVITAFERLASDLVDLGPRCTASFHGLVHPVHIDGSVFGWEVSSRTVP